MSNCVTVFLDAAAKAPAKRLKIDNTSSEEIWRAARTSVNRIGDRTENPKLLKLVR